MKAAFSKRDDRIAPVFDIARQIRVVEVTADGVVGEVDEFFPDDHPLQRVLRLAELGVSVLVCGAISRPLYELICAYAIEVMPFLAGELDDIIKAWLAGELDPEQYAMPGCCGGRGGLRRSGQAKRTQKEDYFMVSGGRGSAMGGGGGAGRGQGRGGGKGGAGRGRMGGPSAGGPGGFCVCPKCGQRESHERGVPCAQMKCPKCGAAMNRE